MQFYLIRFYLIWLCKSLKALGFGLFLRLMRMLLHPKALFDLVFDDLNGFIEA